MTYLSYQPINRSVTGHRTYRVAKGQVYTMQTPNTAQHAEAALLRISAVCDLLFKLLLLIMMKQRYG